MQGRKGMVTLSSRDVMKQADQLLANQVLMEERKVLNSVEDDGIGEDGSIERMGGKGG